MCRFLHLLSLLGIVCTVCNFAEQPTTSVHILDQVCFGNPANFVMPRSNKHKTALTPEQRAEKKRAQAEKKANDARNIRAENNRLLRLAASLPAAERHLHPEWQLIEAAEWQ